MRGEQAFRIITPTGWNSIAQGIALGWDENPQLTVALKGNAVNGFFGLKGRFCQPRPMAWVGGQEWGFDPERVVHILPVQVPERPFQGRCLDNNLSQAFGLS